MENKKEKTIIVGITGSIAAYKAIDLCKLLIEKGYGVYVVLSKSAEEFVSVLALRSLFPGRVYLYNDHLDQEGQMIHIQLAKLADYILIAPASANMISKVAYGQGDCLLSTICLATRATIIVAPAMNQEMWNNTFVKSNINRLKEHGVKVVGPGMGLQACGDYGWGRLLELKHIVDSIEYINLFQILRGRKVIISSGPTKEKIDPVRFISNYSSGKMGYALAKAAFYMGAEVILISGVRGLEVIGERMRIIEVENTQEMINEIESNIKGADVYIGAAAISDYKPEVCAPQKIKKDQSDFNIHFIKNTDVIAYFKKEYPEVFYVGFAAETERLKEYGEKKLREKDLDMIAINDVSEGKVFGRDENELSVISKKRGYKELLRASKEKIAVQLLEMVAEELE